MHICIIINATEILTLTIIKQVYPLQKNLIRNTKQKNDLNLCICNSSDSFNNLPCYPSDSHQSQNAVYWRTGMRVTWALLKLPVYLLAQYITKTKLAAYMKQMYQNAFVVWLQSYKLEEIIATVPPPPAGLNRENCYHFANTGPTTTHKKAAGRKARLTSQTLM